MICKKITYVDFEGTERTEEFWFHLSEAEITELEFTTQGGGLMELMQKCIDTTDVATVIEQYKKILCLSYGQKSSDGRRFIKSKEATEAFTQTEAFSQLYMELVTDQEKGAEFFNKVAAKPTKQRVAPNVRQMVTDAKARNTLPTVEANANANFGNNSPGSASVV